MTDTAPDQPHTYGGLIDLLGIVMEDVTTDRVTASMPVAGNTQPYGLLHGGATAALAETVGSFGAMKHAGEGRIAVGGDLSITHHKAVRSGSVHAEATPAHLGRTVATFDIVVTDDAGARVATARLTCHIRDALHT